MIVNTFFALVLLAVAGLLLYHYTHRPQPEYYSKSFTGDITPLAPLTQPNVSSKALLSWAALASTAAYNLDFVNYQQSLDNLEPFFTKLGYRSFLAAIEAAGIINDLTAKKLIISSVPIGTPTIVNEGVIFGEYTWIIQLPIAIKYQSANQEYTELKAISMIVSRVPPDEAPRGIGIKSFQDAPLSQT